MKALTQSIILTLFLSGCGGAASEYIPAITSALTTVLDIVKENTGKTPEKIPHECSEEFTPAAGTLDVLCTFYVHPPQR